MNTDLFIITIAVAGFFVFLILHCIVFRHIKKRDAIRWFLFLFVGVGATLLLFSAIAALLYGLMASAYFMGVFGLLATSVRIRLLTEIADAREKGLSMQELSRRYNPKRIVRERLARFVSSGDIRHVNGYYVKGVGVTFFVLPAFFLHVMKILYGTYANKT